MNRDMKTLLALLLIHIINDKVFLGMCVSVSQMSNPWAIYNKELQNLEISKEERIKIKHYLCENQINEAPSGYWWRKGDKQPRLDWLKKTILKLENEKR